jgi:hypothetical protein
MGNNPSKDGDHMKDGQQEKRFLTLTSQQTIEQLFALIPDWEHTALKNIPPDVYPLIAYYCKRGTLPIPDFD